MFTGLVETIGTVKQVIPYDATTSGGGGYSIVIGDAAEILSDCNLGDSISTSGVCLTVTEFNESEFKVGVAPESLDRTNLGELVPGSKVNLERAVSAHTRMGGHVVQGHVDTVAEIVQQIPDENSMRLTFKPKDPSVLQYIVEKGFIALDGTSLTITEVDDTKQTFSVMLIAYTQKKVVLGEKKVGDLVNIEVDLTGKLVAKQVKSQVDARINELFATLKQTN